VNRLSFETFSSVNSISNLLDNCPSWHYSSPYQNVDYLKLAVHKHYFYSLIRMTRPFFIKFSINGEAFMILPLSKSIFNSRYFMFGDRAGFGYLDIICRDYNAFPDIKACFEMLIKEFSQAVFHFNRVKQDSLIYQILKDMSAPKSIEECVKIDLIGSYDDYFKSLSKNARQNFRTANNRIVKASKDLSFNRVSGKDISRDILDEMIVLYLKRLSSYKKYVNFLDRIFYSTFDLGFVSMERLNFTEVFLIYIDGKLAAFMLCLRNGDELLVPRLAVDTSFSFYSPGVLLVNAAIKYLFDEGVIKTFDLMQGKETYKFQVGGKIHQCYSFELSKESRKATDTAL
jgi:hypothetical protein